MEPKVFEHAMTPFGLAFFSDQLALRAEQEGDLDHVTLESPSVPAMNS
jgi:hypothetical protein